MPPFLAPDNPQSIILCPRHSHTVSHRTMSRKTAREKLHTPSQLPKQKPAPAILDGRTLVILHPLNIQKRLQSISTISLNTLDETRQSLAQQHRVDIATP